MSSPPSSPYIPPLDPTLSSPMPDARRHIVFAPKALMIQKSIEADRDKRAALADEKAFEKATSPHVKGSTRKAIQAQSSRLLSPIKKQVSRFGPKMQLNGSKVTRIKGKSDSSSDNDEEVSVSNTSLASAKAPIVTDNSKAALTRPPILSTSGKSIKSGDARSKGYDQHDGKNLNDEKHREMVAHFKLRSLSINQAVEVGSDNHEELITSDLLKNSGLVKRESTMVKYWEVLTMILVVFQSIYLPYKIGFDPPPDATVDTFQIVTDVVFIVDVLFQFNITFQDHNGRYLVRRLDVTVHYLTHWFIIDFIAALPLELVSGSSSSQSSGLLKILRLPRLMRIVKVLRAMKALRVDVEMQRWILYSRHAHMMRVLSTLFMIIVICHFSSCLWYAVSEDTWYEKEMVAEFAKQGYGTELCCCKGVGTEEGKTQFLEFTGAADAWDDPLKTMMCYEHGGIGHFTDASHSSCACPTAFAKYLTVLYAVAEMLIGQEHMNPISPLEKAFCFVFTIFGALIMAFTFGSVAVNINNFYAASSKYKRKMEYLFESMNQMNLPRDIQRRVYKYYEYVHESHGSLDGSITSFVPELSEKLQAEILLYLRIEMIASVPFFAACSPAVVYNLVMQLRLQVFLPKDYVVVMGEMGHEMYFIQEGTCEVTIASIVLPPAVPAQVEQANRRRREEHEREEEEMAMSASVVPGMLGKLSTRDRGSARNLLGRKGSAKIVNGRVVAPASLSDRRGSGNGNFRKAGTGVIDSELADKKRGSVLGHFEEQEEIDEVYYNEHEKVLTTLPKGSFFGEVALLLSVKRTANVRSLTFSELCILDRDIFAKILEGYAEDQKIMEEMILSKYENMSNVMAEVSRKEGEDETKENEQAAFQEAEVQFAQRVEKKLTELEATLERTTAAIASVGGEGRGSGEGGGRGEFSGAVSRAASLPGGSDLNDRLEAKLNALMQSVDAGFKNVYEIIGESHREVQDNLHHEIEEATFMSDKKLATARRETKGQLDLMGLNLEKVEHEALHHKDGIGEELPGSVN